MTYASDSGGLSRYVLDMCAATRAAGHEVAIAGDRGVWHDYFLGEGYEWIEVPYKAGPGGMLPAWNRIRKWMKANPVDVLHCHYRRPTLVARLVQRGGWPPILYTVHLSHISLSWGKRWLSDFGDHTHVASVEALDWVVKEGRVPAGRVSLIPHGVHVERWPVTDGTARARARGELGLGEGDRVGAFVGRLDYPKNCDWLIDVAVRWRESGQAGELKLILAGEGPDRGALQRRIDREGLSRHVQLLGQRDPLAVYQAADLLLLPSEREGFSLVCAEGMCTGLPSLRTRTSGTSELIVEGVTGASTPIDRESFVGSSVSLLADGQKLREMRGAAAERVRREFTFERQFAATLALYERLSAAKKT
jgi:glycosyltransferase involved in cell wall biosynthesis